MVAGSQCHLFCPYFFTFYSLSRVSPWSGLPMNSCLYLRHAGLQTYTTTPSSYMDAGVQTQVLTLMQKSRYPQNISPAPRTALFEVLPLVSYSETVSRYGAQRFSVDVILCPGGKQLKGERGYFDLQSEVAVHPGSHSIRNWRRPVTWQLQSRTRH